MLHTNGLNEPRPYRVTTRVRGPLARPNMSKFSRQFAVSFALVSALFAASSAQAVELRVDVNVAHRGLDDVLIQVDVVGAGDEVPAVETVTVTNRGPARFEVDPGTYEIMVSADGFDAWSDSIAVDFAAQTSATLYPAADVTLGGTVVDSTGVASAGASLAVSGARITVPRTATTDDAGAFAFEALPAGIYELRVTSEAGRPVTLERLDVLGDTTVAVVMPDASVAPEVTETRKFSCSAAGGPVAGLWFGFLLFRRRRR